MSTPPVQTVHVQGMSSHPATLARRRRTIRFVFWAPITGIGLWGILSGLIDIATTAS